MTSKELSQLYYLNGEIEEQKLKLNKLECMSSVMGIPSITDRLIEHENEIEDLKGKIDLNIKKCFKELNRLNCYINTVDDSKMRMILSLRYINGLSWLQIAFSIGDGNTSDSVRIAHKRFLANNP